jgi:HlyD family secretion protein
MNRLSRIRHILPVIFIALACASCSKKQKPVFEGSSTLEATEILVGSKTAGTVVEMAVQEGDTVSEGQVIAQIETDKILLQKKQLQAGLAELRLNIRNAERSAELARETFEAAEKKFGRIRSLRDSSSVSQQQYEDAETAFKAARTQNENAATGLKALKAKEDQLVLQVDLADSQLQDATVASPIRGTVLQTYVDRGEIARPGGPVASLADLGRMWIKVYIKESELGKIRLNDEAALKISSDPKREFRGKVTWISEKAEFTPKMVQTRDARSDLVYAVKISVPNPDGVLKIGMPADVVLNAVR